MSTKSIEIYLSDFISFVNKTGTAKMTQVRNIQRRNPYEPFMDFYKILRDCIVDLHKENKSIKVLDHLLESLTDENKKKNYPDAIKGYKRFLGRKNFNWFAPPKSCLKIGNLSVIINPEIGLEEIKQDGTSCFYVIKLYFKKEKLSSFQASEILTLMEMGLREKVKDQEIKFALLDVRNNKLRIKMNHETKEMPLLEGEANSFVTIWNKL